MPAKTIVLAEAVKKCQVLAVPCFEHNIHEFRQELVYKQRQKGVQLNLGRL